MGITKILGAIVLLIIAAGAIWFFVIRDNPPEEVSLADAVGSLSTATAASGTTPAATTEGVTPAVAATAVPTAAGSTPSDINGTWTIDPTQANFTGYRVQEELARIGATTAVGRTSAVTGTATIDGDQVQSITVTADLSQLASDSSQRDNQLRTQALQTNQFPNATFVLDSAQDIPAGLADGEQISTTITGTLELHGVTKEISMPVDAQIVDGVLVIVGSTEILFEDYAITPPSAASVLSVENKAVMELQLFLTKS